MGVRMKKPDTEELKPGPIWGGWWLWEAPVGKVPESPEDTFRRLNPVTRPQSQTPRT